MLKSLLFIIIIICAVALPAFCEPSAKYEVATILGVKRHQSAGDRSSSVAPSYDVSVKVAGNIYLVLYTDTLGTSTARYAAGRELLVHVGKNTITYNDVLGPRSADHEPEAGHNYEPVEVIAKILSLNSERNTCPVLEGKDCGRNITSFLRSEFNCQANFDWRRKRETQHE
jgi:hypothetical protein